MNAQQFVAAFKAEKQWLFDHYTKQPNKRIDALNLSPQQREGLNSLLDDVLRDAFYTILMGLDGAASIGGIQQGYTVSDESGNVITRSNDGELEENAFEAFHSR
ncbi:MAG: hypothetical protein HS117_20710 [Verrucomicrobiaceae bacterium]|nr:hypothetical protein [Verrucomicrobiaceae bacterium]